MRKKSTDMFPSARFPNHLCDLYGQYIGFGAGTSVSGVSIEKSTLFTSDSQSLSRSQGSGSNTVWTWATWMYITEPLVNQVLLSHGSSPEGQIGFNGNGKLYIYNGASTVILTTQIFQTNGWYHIHVAYNTSESGVDKCKLSVNGSLVTTYDTDNRSTAPAFNNCHQSGEVTRIGNQDSTSDNIWHRGFVAQTCMIDGSAVAASSFIETRDDGYDTPKADIDIKALVDAGASANSYFLSNATSLSSNMTTFVDSSSTGHTITTGGNATHSPLGQKVDNSVIYVDGTTDYISVAPSGHSDFTFGTGDWCIEGWFLRKALSGTGNISYIFDFRYASNDANRPYAYLDGSNDIQWGMDNSGNKISSSSSISLGAWFHLAIARSSGTTTMYLNGSSVGTWSDSTDYAVGRPWFFEYPQSNAYCLNGYATELRISKGAARYTGTFTPSTTAFTSDGSTSLLVHSDKFFGVANDDSTHLNHFVNTGTVTTSSSTPTNIFASLNPLDHFTSGGTTALSNGNLTSTQSSGGTTYVSGTFLPKGVGKWVWEVTVTNVVDQFYIGLKNVVDPTVSGSALADDGVYYRATGQKDIDGTASSYGASYTDGDVIRVEWDAGGNSIEFFKNNASQGSITPTAGVTWKTMFIHNDGGSAFTVNFGATNFANTPTAGFKAISTGNLTKPSVSDLGDHFATTLYTGNGSTQTITTNVDADLVFIKNRSQNAPWCVFDTLRGVTKVLDFDTDGVEATDADTLTAFNSTGFALGDDDKVSTNTESYVSFSLKAGGAPTATNSATGSDNVTSGSVMVDDSAYSGALSGSIKATKITVNSELGFSIVSWGGGGSAGTLDHGLNLGTNSGHKPAVIIAKQYAGGSSNWFVYHQSLGATKYGVLQTSASIYTGTNVWNDTAPTTSVFSVGDSGDITGSGDSMVAYIFSDSSPFISASKYTGNNSTNGAYASYISGDGLPLQMAWTMNKREDSSSGGDWSVIDSTREPINAGDNDPVWFSWNGAEGSSGYTQEYVMGGMKLRMTDANFNAAAPYIFLTIGTPIIDTSGRIIAGR